MNPGILAIPGQRQLRRLPRACCLIGAVCYLMQFLLVARWHVGPPWAWVAPIGFALAIVVAIVFTILDVAACVRSTFGESQVATKYLTLALQIVVAVSPLVTLSVGMMVAAPWLKSLTS